MKAIEAVVQGWMTSSRVISQMICEREGGGLLSCSVVQTVRRGEQALMTPLCRKRAHVAILAWWRCTNSLQLHHFSRAKSTNALNYKSHNSHKQRRSIKRVDSLDLFVSRGKKKEENTCRIVRSDVLALNVGDSCCSVNTMLTHAFINS